MLRDEPGLGRSAEQEQFGAALHDLLSQADVPAAARAWAAGDRGPGLAVWRELAGLGVTGLAVPERCGGAGASPLDLVVACQELGHHALPGPVAESLAAVPALLGELAGLTAVLPEPAAGPRAASPAGPHPTSSAAPHPTSSAAPHPTSSAAPHPTAPAGPPGAADLAARCAAWLAGLASGELAGTLAAPPRLPYAVDADVAGLVLLVKADAVWRASPGIQHRSVDGTRRLAELHGTELLAEGPAVARAVDRAVQSGTLASAAYLLGAGRALLEASVRHAAQRAQFGRPIGSFQAVKHQLADVAIGLEFAQPLLDAAAAAAGGGGSATIRRDVSAAKVACADAAYRAARTALQVHGAIGYTEEHYLSLWLVKVRALVPAWGSQAQHRAVVLDAVTCAGGDGR